VNIIKRLFWEKRYNYQLALKEASKRMVQVTDPELLLKMIARFIDLRIKTRHTGILLLQEEKDRYVFKASRGKERIPLRLIKLDRDNPLIRWFTTLDSEHLTGFTEKDTAPFKKRNALIYDDLNGWLKDARLFEGREDLRLELMQIKKEMERFRAVLCIPSFYKEKLLGILILGAKLSGDPYIEEDLNVLITLANDAAMAVRNAQLFEDLRKTNLELLKKIEDIKKLREKEYENYFQTVMALAETIDARDPYTDGHLEKVTQYGMKTAEVLFRTRGLLMEDDFKETLRAALRLHDIGKVGTPDSILHKTGRLSARQWTEMRWHPEIGAHILEPLRQLKKVVSIIRHHHENYDGSGYPDGLKADAIPIESRIIAVVDAYHAMTSKRPYRNKLPNDIALEELKKDAGTQFDPEVVDAFLKTI